MWLRAVGKKRRFMGGDTPNLADLVSLGGGKWAGWERAWAGQPCRPCFGRDVWVGTARAGWRGQGQDGRSGEGRVGRAREANAPCLAYLVNWGEGRWRIWAVMRAWVGRGELGQGEEWSWASTRTCTLVFLTLTATPKPCRASLDPRPIFSTVGVRRAQLHGGLRRVARRPRPNPGQPLVRRHQGRRREPRRRNAHAHVLKASSRDSCVGACALHQYRQWRWSAPAYFLSTT